VLPMHLAQHTKNPILQNHGLLTAGGTVAEAAAFFIALERACHAQLLVESALLPSSVGGSESRLFKTTVSDEVAAYTKAGTGTPEVIHVQFDPEYRLILRETGAEFLH